MVCGVVHWSGINHVLVIFIQLEFIVDEMRQDWLRSN